VNIVIKDRGSVTDAGTGSSFSTGFIGHSLNPPNLVVSDCRACLAGRRLLPITEITNVRNLTSPTHNAFLSTHSKLIHSEHRQMKFQLIIVAFHYAAKLANISSGKKKRNKQILRMPFDEGQNYIISCTRFTKRAKRVRWWYFKSANRLSVNKENSDVDVS
jgi:hypothetical protein